MCDFQRGAYKPRMRDLSENQLRNISGGSIQAHRTYLLIAPGLFHICKKRIWPESCFFVFEKIRVLLVCTYVRCTKLSPKKGIFDGIGGWFWGGFGVVMHLTRD